MKRFIIRMCIIIVLLLPYVVWAGPELPDWSTDVFEALGSKPAVTAEHEGKIVVVGIATDTAKLEHYGFNIHEGNRYRIKVQEIGSGLYRVQVDSIRRGVRGQVKELELP